MKFYSRTQIQPPYEMFSVMLQTSCALTVYNVTRENVILKAKISKESSDTNHKSPVDLLKREKVHVDIT